MKYNLRLLCYRIETQKSGGVGAVVRSLPSNPKVPVPFPVLPRLEYLATFFPAKVHSAFHPSEVGKMSTSMHGGVLGHSSCQWVKRRNKHVIQYASFFKCHEPDRVKATKIFP